MLEWILFRGIMVAFFILANSFFVAAEFAIVSIRETRVQQLIALGRPGARTVLQLKHAIDEFLPAVQFGVTLAALALGWIGEPAVAEVILRLADRWLAITPPHLLVYAHAIATAISFSIITYFEVLLGELVPKSLALQRTERIALAVAGPMDVFIRITRPAIKLVNRSASVVLRLFRAPLHGEGPVHSPEELKLIATAARRVGLLPAFQEQIIHRAIELDHVIVREIMTPRGKIFSLPADLPIEAASARIVEEQHSRIPVYDPARGPEHLIGVVYSKDIARLMHFRAVALGFGMGGAPASSLVLRDVMRDTMFVPETKLAAELLQEFQERRRQIAIVVDEFGSIVGIVSAEDALEQIVGELEDEFDVASSVTLNATGVVTLDGSIPLRDLDTQLQWRFPREPGVETLAGFLLGQLGHLPVDGEFFDHDGRRFTVASMNGRRIGQIRVETLPSPVLEPESREAAAGQR
jgi:CBS domain containing-hemolysin-like protein